MKNLLAQGITNFPEFQGLKGLFGATPGTPSGAATLGELIAAIIQVALLVAAGIAVLFLIYGGYQYVVSRGSEERTESAKKLIESALWGLVIILLSLAAVTIVASVLVGGVPGLGL